MKIIKDIIVELLKEETGIMSVALAASKEAANAKGRAEYAGTLFTRQTVNRKKGDWVIKTGNKETNVSELMRVLASLVGKGEVEVRMMNGKKFQGKIEV